MTESCLYNISQQLRLLARANVRTGRDGRLLSGSISYSLEALRQGLEEALDHLMDDGALNPVDQACVASASRIVGANRPLIRELRKELERSA